MQSETAFKSFVAELQLTPLWDAMVTNGWKTFGDFAFSTADPEGKDATLFEKQVVDVLLASDGSQKHLLPRLRRLYAQAYIVASQSMAEYANPQGTQENRTCSSPIAPPA